MSTQPEMFPQTPAERFRAIVDHLAVDLSKKEAAALASAQKVVDARTRLAIAEETLERLERAEARGNLTSIARTAAALVNDGHAGPGVTATVNGVAPHIDPTTGEVVDEP